MIVVKCDACGSTLEAPDSASGRLSKCPGCREPVQIPVLDVSSPVAQAPTIASATVVDAVAPEKPKTSTGKSKKRFRKNSNSDNQIANNKGAGRKAPIPAEKPKASNPTLKVVLGLVAVIILVLAIMQARRQATAGSNETAVAALTPSLADAAGNKPAPKPVPKKDPFLDYDTPAMRAAIEAVKRDAAADSHDWNLGPTGARGWIRGAKHETTASRHVLITKIDKDSPANQRLLPGDIIIGTDSPFTTDARKALGQAIADVHDGKLTVRVWRNEKIYAVNLQLMVTVAYSETSPWKCPKTEVVAQRAADHLATQKIRGIPGIVAGLGLLAHGDPKHLVKVREIAYQVNTQKPAASMRAWHFGMQGIFLAEYYLATQDKTVLPRLEMLIKGIAEGQSSVGTWGHDFAMPETDRLGGYGTVNQCGLMCLIALELGKRAGIQNAKIDASIAAGARFFQHYVDMGSVSYGDNLEAWTQNHDNNGANGSTAIFLQLAGQRKDARYFARMVTASFNERESGHTGNYWGLLWGAIGACRAGPDAASAFLRKEQWYFELMRRPNDSYVSLGYATPNYRDTYRNWDCTGLALLAMSLPKASLYLTGKGIDDSYHLSSTELEATVAAGKMLGPDRAINQKHFESRSTTDLMQDLANWSPIVRWYAAQALAKKTDAPINQLVQRLSDSNRHIQLGAIEGLSRLGNRATPALTNLIRIASSTDALLQMEAIIALGRINGPSVVPHLLKLLQTRDRTNRSAKTRALCFALAGAGHFGIRGLHYGYKAPQAKAELTTALNRLLDVPEGRARGALTKIYQNWTADELKPLLPTLVHTVKTPAPTGVMFASDIRKKNLQLLAKHNVPAGIEAGIFFLEHQNGWGSEKRTAGIVDTLKSYGSAINPHLKRIEAIAAKHPKKK